MYSLNKIIGTVSLIGAFVLAATIARAVDPPPDGGYPNQNTAEDEDARALVPLRVRTNWVQAEFDAGHTVHNKFENVLNPSNVGQLELAWTAQVIGGFVGTPIVASGRVYIGGGDNKMHAFDEATGVEVWASQEESLFPGQPAATDGLVFADAADGRLRAYDAETGVVVWTSHIRDFGAWPTVIDHFLYMASFEGTLYAFDTRSRAPIWSAPGGCCVQGAPAVDGGRVFQMRTDSSLTAYDTLTGSELWIAHTFAVGTIAAADGKLFYVYPPDAVARDQATGAVIWKSPVIGAAVFASPAVADGLVVAQGARNGIIALDENTGGTVWTAPAFSDVGPSIANGVVYTSNLSGEWDAYNELDGSLLWSVTISSGCFGSCTRAIPVVANGTLFLNGPDDFLRAYRVSP